MTTNSLELGRTFLAVVQAIEETGSAHAFIGALPVLAWGRVRATTDIDLVIAIRDDWDQLVGAPARRGIVQRRQIGPADRGDGRSYPCSPSWLS